MAALTHWLTDWLLWSEATLRVLGWPGLFLFAGGIAFAQMFMLPMAPVALASGLIFGFGRGWIAITLGTALGAAVNFLIARYLARGPIARRLERNEKFRLIDAAIGREGWRIVALLRFRADAVRPRELRLRPHCHRVLALSDRLSDRDHPREHAAGLRGSHRLRRLGGGFRARPVRAIPANTCCSASG